MTREEFDTQLEKSSGIVNDELYLHEQYVASLEQRIAELSTPKNCDGCKYEFEYMYLADRTDICTMCSRDSELKDYYEPKEIQ